MRSHVTKNSRTNNIFNDLSSGTTQTLTISIHMLQFVLTCEIMKIMVIITCLFILSAKHFK